MNRLIIVSNGARLAADALAKGGWRLARVLPERVIAGYGRGANRSTVTTDPPAGPSSSSVPEAPRRTLSKNARA